MFFIYRSTAIVILHWGLGHNLHCCPSSFYDARNVLHSPYSPLIMDAQCYDITCAVALPAFYDVRNVLYSSQRNNDIPGTECCDINLLGCLSWVLEEQDIFLAYSVVRVVVYAFLYFS